MKKSKFSPAQIAGILKEFDNGKKVEKISNTDVAEIMELIMQGKSPLKTIRIDD